MLLPFAGIERRLAEHAYGVIEISGTPKTKVPAGFFVSTEDDTLFFTLNEVVIGDSGKVRAEIVASEVGSKWNVEVGEINQIVHPTYGIDSVTNPEYTIGGREKESDLEARQRADLTVEGLGAGTAASIHTELLKTPNVRSAIVVENYEDYEDRFETPARSIQVFVLGGQDADIARAIHKKKSAGVRAYGTSALEIRDASSNYQYVGFTRAHEVDVHARITISVKNSVFPYDGIDRVKNNLVRYVGGIMTDGQYVAGLNMGDRVVHSKALLSVFGVEGVEDVSIQLSKSEEFHEENINMEIYQVAQMHASNIEVMISV
ncbi:baseplate J/gp47 family protein [Solibacillus silvestris]